jgi:hypothetical protein
MEAPQNKRFYGKMKCLAFWPTCKGEKGKKTLYIKIKDGNPSIKSTRQMRTQVDTTQRKNKNEQLKKKPYVSRTQGYKMTINNNKEDLR